MVNYLKTDDFFKQFEKYAKVTGFVFVALGLVGILYPIFMTVALVNFIAWIMLFAGVSVASFTWVSNKTDISGWLKSFGLITISLLLLINPIAGASALGLVLAIYFLIDGFSGVSLALSMRPNKGWIMWMINAIMSFMIAGLFIFNWPFSSMNIIGLLVGFSLFFDGLSLVSGSFALKHTINNSTK